MFLWDSTALVGNTRRVTSSNSISFIVATGQHSFCSYYIFPHSFCPISKLLSKQNDPINGQSLSQEIKVNLPLRVGSRNARHATASHKTCKTRARHNGIAQGNSQESQPHEPPNHTVSNQGQQSKT